MSTYTLDEIAQQIRALEGCDVVFPNDPGVRFGMRYDEFFKEPLSGESTVSELKLRVHTFTATQQVLE